MVKFSNGSWEKCLKRIRFALGSSIIRGAEGRRTMTSPEKGGEKKADFGKRNQGPPVKIKIAPKGELLV